MHAMVGRRGPNRFNEREVARAVKAIDRAGKAIERVEIDPISGKLSVILAAPDARHERPLDNWLRRKQPAVPAAPSPKAR
jgi:hypothetical protein